MNVETNPSGTVFCYRLALTSGTNSVVPAITGWRAVMTGYTISANVSGAGTIQLQTTTGNDVAIQWGVGVTTDFSDSNSGLYVASEPSDGFEVVITAATFTSGSITVYGLRIPNEAPCSIEDETYTP